MSYSVTIAVCKGRVLDDTAPLWQACGWSWPSADRQLWFPPTEDRPGLIIARGSDIPFLVEQGIAAFGIVGRDVLFETAHNEVLDVLDLRYAACRMVLAAQERRWPDGPVRVATKYPRVTREYFADRAHPAEVVSLSGSLELAPHIGLAPYIVDLVQTGRTLRQHHLLEVETLFSSTARLIANPGVWRLSQEAEKVYGAFATAVERHLPHHAYIEETSP